MTITTGGQYHGVQNSKGMLYLPRIREASEQVILKEI